MLAPVAARMSRMASDTERLAPLEASGDPARESRLLIVSSLLALLLFTLHVADDIARGFEPGNLSNYPATIIYFVWLYATLVLAGRRSGYWIVLVASLMGAVVPALHMRGAGLGAKIAASSGGFFFTWTLLALGATSLFSLVLSVRGLWRLRRASAGG